MAPIPILFWSKEGLITSDLLWNPIVGNVIFQFTKSISRNKNHLKFYNFLSDGPKIAKQQTNT
jgi:hypothetical protein